ncbi:MAG: hypothetical protein JWO94_2882 [Verrucomicrobiaceae bacterium]|nr:hypothetical protein [Verrucomicrobiaceae bacterium]
MKVSRYNGFMSTTSELQLDTTVLGQEVPLNRVDQALRELWADENTSKTRASLMNVAIYSEDSSSLERNTQLLGEITEQHSCRSLLIVNVPDAPKHTARAWVTAHCQLYDGKRSVCCEQLSFLMEGGTADSIRNFVFAHLDSDLPLTVWWQGELTERLDERFYSVMDALIVDSSQWANPGSSLRRVLAARDSRTSRLMLSDLSWMRSRFMRLALAGACHDAKVLEELPNVNQIKITHGKGHRMSALMLVAWIGTQLKCRLAAGDSLRFERYGGATLNVTIIESDKACPLQSLELSGPDVSISVSRDPDSCFIRSKMEHAHHQRDEVQPAGTSNDGDLIADQMGRLGGTTLYFEMLPLLQSMLK